MGLGINELPLLATHAESGQVIEIYTIRINRKFPGIKLSETTGADIVTCQIQNVVIVVIEMSETSGANLTSQSINILGPVIHSGLVEKMPALLLGSLFVFLGAALLSKRVIETIGKGITTLDPYSGFAAQFGAGICVLFFTFLGMPVSTTYCIIGGISGVGISKGMKTVKIELIKKIIANWILAPSLAFIISFVIMKAIS